MPTLFTMTVDTEEEWDWDSGVWPTENLQLRNIHELTRFQETCERHGVAATYFTDWAVFQDLEARDLILDLSSRNHVEIGMHIHPWNTPPLNRSREVTGRDSYLRTLPEEQIEAKLGTVYRAFEDAALRPTSFRGGRYSSDGPIHEFLRAHGFLADASVVPYTSWPDDGSPDYRHRNLEPVRLAPRHDKEAALWEIPLTLGFTRKPFEAWARRFRAIENSWLSKLKLIGLMQRSGFVRRVWLNFEDTPALDMLALLRVLRPMELPAVCFTVHSSSLSIDKNPYSRDEGSLHRIWSTVDEVFKVLAGWDDFQPATVSEVALQLEAKHHASYRHQPSG